MHHAISYRVLLFIAGIGLLSGCAFWNAEILNTSHVYPAFPAAGRLIGRFSVSYDARDHSDDVSGVQLYLFSDGAYYEAFFAPERPEVFVVNAGHWRYQRGHLQLESDHRAADSKSSRTQPDYTAFTTSPHEAGPLQLLPASIGSLRDGQLFLHDQPSKGNFFPDRVREGSDTLVQSQQGFRGEAAEKKLLENRLRESNDWARHATASAETH